MKCVISNPNCKYQIHLQNPLTFSAGTTIDITAEKNNYENPSKRSKCKAHLILFKKPCCFLGRMISAAVYGTASVSFL